MSWEIHFGRGFVLRNALLSGSLQFATREEAQAVADEHALPDVVLLERRTPNAKTQAAIAEASAGGRERFANVSELMTELDTDDTPEGWLVWYSPLPINGRFADWRYARINAADESDIGTAESRAMCLQAIDYIESEEKRAETEEGKAASQRFVDAGMRTFNRAMMAEALKPFAIMATPWIKQDDEDSSSWAREPDTTILVIGREYGGFNQITVGDLRRAHAAFTQYQEQR